MTTTDLATVTAHVQSAAVEFALVLPPQLTPEMFTRLSIGLLRQNVKLAQAAQANEVGFLAALLECARLGLEPGTKEVALTPFNNRRTGVPEIVCIPQWQGLVKRMLNTGRVHSVHAECVFSADRFRYDPGMERPEHQIDWFGDRGELLGAYAFAVLDDGAVSKVAVIGPREAERAKAMSRGSDKPDSPWNTDTAEMWRKTAVRRLEDWVPSSSTDRTFLLRQEIARLQAGVTAQPASPVMELPAVPVAHQAAVESGPAVVDTSHLLAAVDAEPQPQDDPATGDAGGRTASVPDGSDTPAGVDLDTGLITDAEVVDDGDSDGEQVLR